MKSETFTYHGDELVYCRAAYNHSGQNERAVEIPIARAFVAQQTGVGLEVGDVLSHYDTTGHVVVDRYEGENAIRRDVFEHRDPADWIVAISTLEHVRWDEPNMERHPEGSVRALTHLLGLLRPGGRMLVTIPMGWQPFLDSMILDERLPTKPDRQCSMVRMRNTEPVEWVQASKLVHRRYAATSIWAESVWVAEFEA